MNTKVNTDNYLYLKEIGLDIRIKGVLYGLEVELSKSFDTISDAEKYLIKEGWKNYSNTKYWYKKGN